MKIRRSVALVGFDPAPALGFFPALRAEWDALRFVDGTLRHPDDGSVVEGLELLRGDHGQPGAHYLVRPEPDDAGDVTPFEFDVDRTLRDGIELSAASDELDASGRAVLRFTPSPEIDGSFDTDLGALSRDEELGGCMAWLLGGRARATGVIDVNALDRGGRFVAMKGRINRFPFEVTVSTSNGVNRLDADVEIVIRAKGIARPALWLGRRAVRRSIAKSIDDAATALGSGRRLEVLGAIVEHNGGHAATVHRLVWEAGWEPSVPETLDRQDPDVVEVLSWLVADEPPESSAPGV